MELAYSTQRAPLVSIYNSLWGLGALMAAWTTYGTFRIENDWAWRIPSILQTPSGILQLCLYFLIEESRWLISKERDVEAEKLVAKYHANSNAMDPMVPLEMEEIHTALRF
ncbi:putative General substrate transporter [Seiridium unicorne]|uniref:General substrate transporter n=1 Tax=Seiridium unicorne TaxID=138068 RepID=A0ABR2ULT9_9PEZI